MSKWFKYNVRIRTSSRQINQTSEDQRISGNCYVVEKYCFENCIFYNNRFIALFVSIQAKPINTGVGRVLFVCTAFLRYYYRTDDDATSVIVSLLLMFYDRDDECIRFWQRKQRDEKKNLFPRYFIFNRSFAVWHWRCWSQ